MILKLILLVGLVAQSTLQSQNLPNATELLGWSEVLFEFPSAEVEASAIKDGHYVFGAANLFDADVRHAIGGQKQRIFLTTPRMSGTGSIPFTLGELKNTTEGYKMAPYPSYEIHQKGCDGIFTIFRLKIDSCNQLWAVDKGGTANNVTCGPKLLIFDLLTDQIVYRYEYPEGTFKSNSLFATPVLDIKDPGPEGKCQDVKVYSPDMIAFGLTVYDHKTKSAWRLENDLFRMVEEYRSITIANASFTLSSGVFGLGLSPQNSKNRKLFFYSMCGIDDHAISLDVVNNQTLWKNNPYAVPEEFKTIGNHKVQAMQAAFDEYGNWFFGLSDPPSIACWNMNKPHTEENIKIVLQDTDKLQFATGVKVNKAPNGKNQLWITTNRLQKKLQGGINYIVQYIEIDELLGGKQTC